MISSLFLSLSVILANLTNLITQIALPKFLPPAEYAELAVLWATGQFVSVFIYEWMRFGVLRFSVSKDPHISLQRTNTLIQTYILASAFSFLIVALLLASFWLFNASISLSLIISYAIFQGIFDGKQAFNRAQFKNTDFAVTWTLRSLFSLSLTLSIAAYTHDGELSLLGLIFSYPLSILLVSPKSVSRLKLKHIDRPQLQFLARYGAFAAVSGVLSACLPAILKFYIISTLNIDIAGAYIYALDISQKILAIIGLAINIIILQKAIRQAEFGTEYQKAEQVRAQISSTAALIIPAAVGFYLIQNHISPILVPENYQIIYMKNIGLAILAFCLMTFRMFAIDPIFLIAGNSKLSMVGPVSSIFVTIICAYVLGHDKYSELYFSLSLCAGMSVSILISGICAAKTTKIEWPVLDLTFIAIGCVLLACSVKAINFDNGNFSLFLSITVGSFLYCGVMYITNTANVRNILNKLVANPKTPR